MKAAVLHANEDIRYEEIDTPKISDDEVLVKVRATGICGSDVPRVLHNGAHYYPIVLGHEFSGEVVEIGKNVESLQIGDRVSGVPLIPCKNCPDCNKGNFSLCKNYTFIGSRIFGSFAEYVKLPEKNAVKFDPSVSFEQAAFFEPATVALHGIKCANYRGGKDVAVLGGGTIGLFTMQWAKILGAKSVTVFDVSEKRLALAKKLGADFTVNVSDYKEENKKYDFLFETAGQVSTIKDAFYLAANKAVICCIGTPHKSIEFTAPEWELMNRKEFILTGSWMSYSSPFPGDEWELTAHYFKTGELKFEDELVFKKFELKDIKEAFMMFKNPKSVGGKILICNDD